MTFRPIVLKKDSYNLDWFEFTRGAEDEELKLYATKALEVFEELTGLVKNTRSITLTEATGKSKLANLAQWGKLAYDRLFEIKPEGSGQETASQLMKTEFQGAQGTPAPIFVSEYAPFPWEVLYEGPDDRDAERDAFWGCRYQVGRFLTRFANYRSQQLIQALDSDMLFCIYLGLINARDHERPDIEQVVKQTVRDRFRLLGPVLGSTQIQDGRDLLGYLATAPHNMVHFACHCVQSGHDTDVLHIHLVDESRDEADMPAIELQTFVFNLPPKDKFQIQPLVFLNACHTGGAASALKRAYNLPLKFFERGAAAIIATACPVPDIFGAAFARHFYTLFLKGRAVEGDQSQACVEPLTIGEALRETRLHFLKTHNNPLGLAYGLYSPAHYRRDHGPASEE